MLAVLRILGPGLKILFHSGGDTKKCYLLNFPAGKNSGFTWIILEVGGGSRSGTTYEKVVLPSSMRLHYAMQVECVECDKII